MLKATEQSSRLPRPEDERPVGELVHELVDQGKEYARAEMSLAKAIATAKANALKIPAIMFAAAFLIIQAAINVLGVGGLLGLAPLIGPVLAALAVFVIMLGIAGGLAWYGAKKLREDL